MSESEDLENVPLVRMEDVQPARDRACEVYEELETCIVDSLDYVNECIVENDEDSHIGSMVSIRSEEVVRCYSGNTIKTERSEDNEQCELIVPDILEDNFDEIPIEIEVKPKIENPESWPTLEILPGGVIKNGEKCDTEDIFASICQPEETSLDNWDNIYACAKCSQSFKYLFCLVEHVRWHKLEQKNHKVVRNSRKNEERPRKVRKKKDNEKKKV